MSVKSVESVICHLSPERNATVTASRIILETIQIRGEFGIWEVASSRS